jgi:regulatory protein
VPGADDCPPRALELAYRYLNRRERTVAEMRRHLGARGCRSDDAEAAIGQLLDQGYLDDARYAQLFAEDKRELEQWGSGRIQRALLERGIDCALVEQAVAADQACGDRERAILLLRRRFQTCPRDRRERDRALGMLLRKGYEPELALDALAAYAHDGAGSAAG